METMTKQREALHTDLEKLGVTWIPCVVGLRGGYVLGPEALKHSGLGLRDDVREVVKKHGFDLEHIPQKFQGNLGTFQVHTLEKWLVLYPTQPNQN